MQGQFLSAVQGDPINTEGLEMPDTVRTAGVVLQDARDIKAGEAILRMGETYSTCEKCQVERLLRAERATEPGEEECRRQSSLMRGFRSSTSMFHEDGSDTVGFTSGAFVSWGRFLSASEQEQRQ